MEVIIEMKPQISISRSRRRKVTSRPSDIRAIVLFKIITSSAKKYYKVMAGVKYSARF